MESRVTKMRRGEGKKGKREKKTKKLKRKRKEGPAGGETEG